MTQNVNWEKVHPRNKATLEQWDLILYLNNRQQFRIATVLQLVENENFTGEFQWFEQYIIPFERKISPITGDNLLAMKHFTKVAAISFLEMEFAIAAIFPCVTKVKR